MHVNAIEHVYAMVSSFGEFFFFLLRTEINKYTIIRAKRSEKFEKKKTKICLHEVICGE